MVVHGADVPEAKLPRLAIRPYPSQYARSWTMRDGSNIMIRPIRPEDEPLLVKYHKSISERSFYMRYAQKLEFNQRVAHERLLKVCFNDYDREIALVAVRRAVQGGQEILAVARLSRIHGANEGEVGILVSDQFQQLGLGSEMLGRLIEIGRQEGLSRVLATMLNENQEMQKLCVKHGFQVSTLPGGAFCKGELNLEAPRPAA